MLVHYRFTALVLDGIRICLPMPWYITNRDWRSFLRSLWLICIGQKTVIFLKIYPKLLCYAWTCFTYHRKIYWNDLQCTDTLSYLRLLLLLIIAIVKSCVIIGTKKYWFITILQLLYQDLLMCTHVFSSVWWYTLQTLHNCL